MGNSTSPGEIAIRATRPQKAAASAWLGAALGVMNGYPSMANGGSFFAALPLATVEGRHFGINFGIVPSMGKVDGAVILQFKLRLN